MLRFLPLAVLGLLAACASPCDAIRADMRRLNAEAIRDPGIALDGRYLKRFQELAARSVEHECLN